MSGLWNFLFSFSFDKSLTSYTVDELNGKLRELDLDKHLDSLEKAFEVQKTIIDKLKYENDALKKELRELKAKYNENGSMDNLSINSYKISYPELKTSLCYVKWSGLENNVIESRFIDTVRQILVRSAGVELEVQPWGGEKSVAQPLIVFFPASSNLVNDVDRVLQGLQSSGATILVVTHECENGSDSYPSSSNLLSGFVSRFNIRLIVDIQHRKRQLEMGENNTAGINQIVELIKSMNYWS